MRGVTGCWLLLEYFLEVLPRRAGFHPRALCGVPHTPLARGKTGAELAPYPSPGKTPGAALAPRVSRKPPLQARCGNARLRIHACHASRRAGDPGEEKRSGADAGVQSSERQPRTPPGNWRWGIRHSSLNAPGLGASPALGRESRLRAQV